MKIVQYLQDCIVQYCIFCHEDDYNFVKEQAHCLKKKNYLCYIMCFDYFLYVV